jgi:hypothetical protein
MPVFRSIRLLWDDRSKCAAWPRQRAADPQLRNSRPRWPRVPERSQNQVGRHRVDAPRPDGQSDYDNSNCASRLPPNCSRTHWTCRGTSPATFQFAAAKGAGRQPQSVRTRSECQRRSIAAQADRAASCAAVEDYATRSWLTPKTIGPRSPCQRAVGHAVASPPQRRGREMLVLGNEQRATARRSATSTAGGVSRREPPVRWADRP